MELVGRSWFLDSSVLPHHSGLYISYSRSRYLTDSIGCINSSTGYHYVPSGNAVCIVVASDFWSLECPGSGPGVFYSVWWGHSTDPHLTVGCLNSPNYYLQQELSLWR